MVAIVDIAGQQFKVSAGQKVYVHRLDSDKGSKLSFDQVLLVSGDAGTTVGAPTVSGAKIEATLLDHVKGDKVVVYKKKRRKGYEKKNGHRQSFSQIKIDSIVL
ncbi:MAG TPA: 50S ribosomal protein L21 [Saprospiraceae bacterium]|nr:50S ribosomal protein L21 [Saprospiraceae bacterium]